MNWFAAKLLSQWWSHPQASTLTQWVKSNWWESTFKLWRRFALPDAELVKDLGVAVQREHHSVQWEYERLFVGPAAVPCPPYETIWRASRPRLEQGMTTGALTQTVQRLYTDYGLRLRPDCRELPDHIAIEFEVLSNILRGTSAPRIEQALVNHHLSQWVPRFCEAVTKETELDFYRTLSALTVVCVGAWAAELAE